MALRASQLKVGDTREEVVIENLSRTQLVMYAGASGDYNPVHTDEVFATKIAGYPTVFAHGMLSMGATGRMLTNWPKCHPDACRSYERNVSTFQSNAQLA